MISFLNDVREVIQILRTDCSATAQIDDLTAGLLKKAGFNPEQEELYQNRLLWGIEQYLQRHYSAQHTGN